jgi:DNA-binding MarR family transcriptional regulator
MLHMPAIKRTATARTAATASRAPPGLAQRKPADGLAHFDFQIDSLGYALRRAQVHAYELFFEMLGALELSPARLTALSLIAMEPEINQATLARRLNVAGPSVMKLIDALEHAGFIRRMEVPGDRRRYSLLLTPSGNAMLETLRDRLAAYEAQLAQRLSSAERKQLMTLLKKLVG